MENISEIKSGFIDYLKDKYGDEESSKIKSYSPELSIFMYSSDFQQYLVGNGYADVSVFSKSISEIKDMLSSGENQTEADAPNEEGVNESPDVNTGENVIQNNNTNGMNQVGDSFLITALTDVVNNDQDLFSAFNTNSNGTIDAEEITAFLDSVEAAMQADPDSYETIFDGIAKGIQEIKGIETSPESILESIYESEEALEYLDAADAEKDYSILGTFTPNEAKGTCVYCNHCAPCPMGLNIGLINKFYDLANVGDPMAKEHYEALDKHAADCVGCGYCDGRCPFRVHQSERMKEIAAYFGR